jgi:hypothetical protein
VLDNGSGQPIAGTVIVDLEAAAGDYYTVMETSPDVNGKFTFKNVASGRDYIIAVSARNNDGVDYIPYVLVSAYVVTNTPWGPGASITPGTDVGTIKMSLPKGPSSGTILMALSSQNTAGQPSPATVTLALREFFADRVFQIPLFTPGGVVVATTDTEGTNCPTNTACATASMEIPAAFADWNAFKGAQHIQYPIGLYTIRGTATVPNTSKLDCSPNVLEDFLIPNFAGATTNAGMSFSNCQ